MNQESLSNNPLASTRKPGLTRDGAKSEEVGWDPPEISSRKALSLPVFAISVSSSGLSLDFPDSGPPGNFRRP